jgi:hypothetical protein
MTAILTELRATGSVKGYWILVMIIFVEAAKLILVRTHYIIDIVAGYICAKYFSIWVECIAIVWDVWLVGLPAHKRGIYYFRPCARCGWSNDCAAS